jgi:hypothetical protein
MATLDLSGYRMIARYAGQRAYILIQPATQGTAAVGDTVILREGETYRATAVNAPETQGTWAGQVRIWLEAI